MISIARGIGSVDRDEWNTLVGEDGSPFLEWEWLNALESSGSAEDRTGWAPCHLLVRENGELVAACPLYLKSHSMGEFVFDSAWAEAAYRAGIAYYPKLLVGVPFTPHAGRRFLTRSTADRPRLQRVLVAALLAMCEDNGLSSVHVNFCAPDEVEALTEAGFLPRLGYQYHWKNRAYRDFDDYLATLRSKRRHAVKRERAELSKAGIKVEVISGRELSEAQSKTFYELYRSTVEKFPWGHQYLNARFFDAVRRDFGHRLALVCARRDDRMVAGTFNVEKAGVFYGRYWGCFEEVRFLHFNIAYYAGIDYCIKKGWQRFEPGAGGEYKWLRGFEPVLTYSAHYIANRRLRNAVSAALAHERRQVQDWVRYGSEHGQLKHPSTEDAKASFTLSDRTER